MRFKHGLPVVCTLALSVITGMAQAALPASYKVTEINFAAGTWSWASGINDAGHVVGSVEYPEAPYPWLVKTYGFKYNGSVTEIAPLPGQFLSSAAAINNAGVVVGTSYNYSQRGGAINGLLHDGSSSAYGNPSYFRTEATDINQAGQIVGRYHSDVDSFPERARGFLYANGTMTDLGTLDGGYTVAEQINDKGQIVGNSFIADNSVSRGFIYQNGVMTALPTLGGSSSSATDINNHGHIVGSAQTADGRSHAFLYVDGVMTDLGTIGWLAQLSSSHAVSINDRGDVLGYATTSTFSRKYWLYSAGELLDLEAALGPDSEWRISNVAELNESGQIAATAERGRFGSPQALRLDPVSAVPEPATYAMLGAGLLLIGLRTRRNSAKGEQAAA